MSGDRGGPARRRWVGPAAAIVVAFAVRVAAGFLLNVGSGGPRGFDLYARMADGVVSGRGLGWDFYEDLGWKWANRAPLYPLLLAGVRALAGAPATHATILVQAAIGAAACGLPALLARRWAGPRAGTVALWAAALWPYSVLTDTGLVEHVLFAPLVLAAGLCVLRAADDGRDRTAFVAGIVCGAAALARITFVPAVGLLALPLVARRGLRPAVLLALGTAVALAPWVIRNGRETGSYVLGSDGGRALWIANAPQTFTHYPSGSIDDTERFMVRDLPRAEIDALRALGEIEQDARFRRMALANIAADPPGVALGAARKCAALWSVVYNPAPIDAAARRFGGPLRPTEVYTKSWAAPARYAIHAVMMCALLAGVCAAVAKVPRVRADLGVVLALALAFTAVAAAFWGQPRYLAPLHGFGIALGAAAVVCRRRPGADSGRPA